MEEWTERNKGKCFITDLGSEQKKEIDGNIVTIGQYAVWSPIANADNHCIVEVGCDCKQLQEKYHISDTMVYYLAKEEC